jgi:hypothetical protein
MNQEEIYFQVKQFMKDKKLNSKEADEFFRVAGKQIIMDGLILRAKNATDEAINHAKSEGYKFEVVK